MDGGLLLLRLVVGLGIAAHGGQKLFGWNKGPGLGGAGQWLESLGFSPGRTFALLNGLGEFAGGLLLALGLFTPLGAALVIATMVVAIMSVHLEKGFFNQNQGYELPLLYATGAAAIALMGPGAVSFDRALGLDFLASREAGLLAIGVGILGGVVSLLLRPGAVGALHPRSR